MDDLFEFLEDAQRPKIERYAWMDQKRFVLVGVDNLTECIDACLASPEHLVSIDLETSGLDNRVINGRTKDFIVGVCLSPDGETGYYLPLKHFVVDDFEGTREAHPANIPWSVFEPEFRRLINEIEDTETPLMGVFHNGKFDQEFLQFPGDCEPFGEWDSHKTWHDTLILAYLRNSRARVKGLKALAAADPEANPVTSATGGPGLGMKMWDLPEVFKVCKGEDYNGPLDFSLLDPTEEEPLIYGGSDAICTWLLCKLLLPDVVGSSAEYNQGTIYAIERSCVAGTRWMERCRIPTNPVTVMELIHLGQQEWFDSIMEVYEAATEFLGRDVMPGYYKVLRDNFVAEDPDNLLPQQLIVAKKTADRMYPASGGKIEKAGKQWPSIYDVNAPMQLVGMFDEMQVPGLVRTEKSGQVKTSKDVLEAVIEKASGRFPFMGKIRRFREVSKALSNYLIPLLTQADPNDHRIRINFNAHKVDTGRFSTPAPKIEIEGWPQINFQSVPSTYDPSRPECMGRIRECFEAEEDFVIVASDFAGEELRIVTNLSGEQLWTTEFFRCSACSRTFDRGNGKETPPAPPPRCPNCGSDKIGDIHTLTGISLYGADAPNQPDWKQKRGNAKGTNFALCYGGGGNAVVRATGCDKNEGWRIKSQFDGTYKGLQAWWGVMHKFARKHGFITTAFGRKYPVPDINHADGGFRSKAERNSVNGPIQGAGADMIKIAMAVIFKEFKKRGWLNLARMIASMHDELVFEIHKSILEEAIEVIVDLMTNNGFIKGKCWPIPFTSDVEMGKTWNVPWDLNAMRYSEVRYLGDKKIKKPEQCPEGVDFATLPTIPESLRGLLPKLEAEVAGGQGGGQDAPSSPPPTEGGGSTPPPVQGGSTSLTTPAVTQALGKGQTYFHTIYRSLTIETMDRLARVIHECKGRGTRQLGLKLPDGTILEGWAEETILINEQEFHYAAQRAGI